MPRPFKFRRVGWTLMHDYFKPRGIPLSDLQEVILRLDEIEAMRLADIEGLYHEEAAAKMNVSRQTFDRILNSAHRTVAGALINGKAIRIEGGNVINVADQPRPWPGGGGRGGGRWRRGRRW
ncbi:MAG: DUF134 domain-containing protein [Proteobacteria bacterium]|nr:DUF134 domain-containing protein [Pseudomonadota bacterium]